MQTWWHPDLYSTVPGDSWEWAHSEVATEVRRRERAVGRISVENEIIHLALV